jgi:AraC family transcriptional regulator
MGNRQWTGEEIIADTLKTRADVQVGAQSGESTATLARWRQFVGSYVLPPLPSPTFVVHLGGKRGIRHRQGADWSDRAAIPGTVTIVPAGVETEWLINGELDVATMTIGHQNETLMTLPDNLSRFAFAFADPLSVALTRQILSELYLPRDSARDSYVSTLVQTLQSHVVRGRASIDAVPVNSGDMQLMHSIINDMNAMPAESVRTEQLAEIAGMSSAQFCRSFKKITGHSPKRYALKIRVERAKELLSHSPLSAGEISDQLGFSSQSHFTRVFRDLEGVPPVEYRLICAGKGKGDA